MAKPFRFVFSRDSEDNRSSVMPKSKTTSFVKSNETENDVPKFKKGINSGRKAFMDLKNKHVANPINTTITKEKTEKPIVDDGEKLSKYPSIENFHKPKTDDIDADAAPFFLDEDDKLSFNEISRAFKPKLKPSFGSVDLKEPQLKPEIHKVEFFQLSDRLYGIDEDLFLSIDDLGLSSPLIEQEVQISPFAHFD